MNESFMLVAKAANLLALSTAVAGTSAASATPSPPGSRASEDRPLLSPVSPARDEAGGRPSRLLRTRVSS